MEIAEKAQQAVIQKLTKTLAKAWGRESLVPGSADAVHQLRSKDLSVKIVSLVQKLHGAF